MFCDLLLHKKGEFTALYNKFFSSCFSSTSNAYWYMYGYNLRMKFPPDFHNYTELNALVNSFF